MADSLFTDSQKPEDPAKLSEIITKAIGDLQMIFPQQNVEALYWNDNFIAIPLEVMVDLPTRGPVNEVDIREKEPIYLLLHRLTYPYGAPSVYSNRRDFPIERLPHLNPTRPGTAANFCLHRGNLDNWFAEHTISDLVKRVRGWLRDAAADRLIRREDGFEETRLIDTFGYALYNPTDLRKYVDLYWKMNNGNAGFSFLWYKLLNNTEKEPLVGTKNYAINLFTKLEPDAVEEPLGLSKEIAILFQKHGPDNALLDRMMFGILAWPAHERISGEYFGHLPDNLKGLQEWTENLGIPLTIALKVYLTKDLQIFGGVPVTLVVPRPQRMIRTTSNLEILNFMVAASGDHWPKDGAWNMESPVWSMGHRTPLTLQRAREISSHPVESDLGRLLFLGCGAIGSKVIMHLARGGQGKMTLVDYDDLSPHNLVRHALLYESLGQNKADAIKKAVTGIFYADKGSLQIEVNKESAANIFLNNKELLDRHDWLIDASASPMVLNLLSQTDLPDNISCCRCEIADSGKLGFMSIEGPDRNPRMDDLQVSIFDLAIDNDEISQWLKSNQKEREGQVGSVLEEVHIGLSCSSETMRLSDEVVSLHAATFANGFRKYSQIEKPARSGIIQISHYSDKGEISFSSRAINVFPFTKLKTKNNAEWEVRLKYGIEKEMKWLLRQASPNETGGLLIGLINRNRRIIYVTRILHAPPDSKGSPYAFVRGIEDVPEKILDIQDKTGGLLGYIGEWHTHPAGGPRLSSIDREAIHKIKSNLDKIPLPTHVMVVTKIGLYPFIFTTI